MIYTHSAPLPIYLLPDLCYNKLQVCLQEVAMFAVNVAINLPVKNLFRQFTYSVPEALQFIDSGWRVGVPFSGQKVEGCVMKC